MTLQEFVIFCQKRYHELGEVEIPSLWPNSSVRNVILSHTQPPIPLGDVVKIWFDLTTTKFYKSSNWKSLLNVKWEQQLTFEDLYLDVVSSGVLSSNTLDGPIYINSPTAPSLPNEAITLGYLNTVISSIQTGTGNILYGEPVQTRIELANLDTSSIPDKQIRYVEEMNRIYGYDAQSSVNPDNEFTILPVSGVGRWISTDAQLVTGGSF